jgi:ABC-type uncharacterized transport system auxiliary subunit
MRRLALTLAVCALSGCGLMPAKTPPKTDFDFGPESSAAAGSAALSHTYIVVYQITAPTWMDGTGMFYRLAYHNAAVPLPYAGSEWVMPPAELLTQRLRSTVAGTDNGETLRVSMHPAAVYTLRAELLEFEQIFDAPDRSRGVLRLRATLEGEGVRAQHTFAIERAARTANAAGGVMALAECSDELVRSMSDWVAASRVATHEAAAADLGDSRPFLSAERE